MWTDGRYKPNFFLNMIIILSIYLILFELTLSSTYCCISQYEGEVHAGLRHGKGSYRSSSCPSSYVGQWINGKRQGWVNMAFFTYHF